MSQNPAAQLGLFHPCKPIQGRVVPRGKGHHGAATLRLCVLGSGSGGNCTVVRLGGGAILLDAGFGPSTTRRRLSCARIKLEQVRAVCLTHLDRDHFRPTWPATLLRLGIRLYVHRWHVPGLSRVPTAAKLFDAGLVQTVDGQAFQAMPGLRAATVRLQHDRQGTLAYRLEADGGNQGAIGYATDLGHVPPRLIEHLAGVDLLCLESNYDEHMTIHSARPRFVNRRNLSDSGHLSNEQAFDAVRSICDASPAGNPKHIVLMHRSGQCNHPMKVKRVFERDARLARRITLAEQRRRTRWFMVKPLPRWQRQQLRWMF